MESDTSAGREPAGEPTAIAPAPAKEGAVTVADAARSLIDWRRKSNAAVKQSVPDASAADRSRRGPPAAPQDATTEQTESAPGVDPEADTAPAAEQAPGETESQADPEPQSPPIEPPRSWTKDEKERFKSLPRETQEYLSAREQERDREIRRTQNEAAERAKALDAERTKVEQARIQYESALPQLLQTLQDQQAGEFADIKTIADVEKLAREDWPRYLQWDSAQKRIAAVGQELIATRQRQAQEKHQKFVEFAGREDKLFAERVPEMGDPEKAAKLQKQALGVLRDLGFSEEELGRSWNGQGDLSLRDHRVQLLVRDAILWRDAQVKAKAAAQRPVPPVVRPGAAQNQAAAREQMLSDLSKRLDATGNVRDAAAFIAARRRAG